jgi:hypothetical protein
MSCRAMNVGSNLICSLEVAGTQLALNLLDELGLIVADEIAEIRMCRELSSKGNVQVHIEGIEASNELAMRQVFGLNLISGERST